MAPPTAASPAPQPAPSGAPSGAPAPIFFAPINPATQTEGVEGADSSNYSGPSLRALPVNPSDGTPDASLHRKFYTLTASLREIYDSNVNTSSSSNAQSSLETVLGPSILVDFPSTTGQFTGRYSLGLVLYGNGPGGSGNGGSANGGSNSNNSLQITHELVAQYTHAISTRFQLSLSEQFRYFTEPSILQSTGTNYQDGAYISNTLNGTLSAQWTPLISSTATLSNTVVRYDNQTVGDAQNSVETTGSGSVGYAILPKITTSIGATIDNVTYQTANRGYSNYTLFGGVSWLALPSLSFSGQAGASYTETEQDVSSFGPYGALSANWTLGARSSLNFSYSHAVTPSDQVGANGQESDRFSSGFVYQITPRLTSHLDGILTLSTVTSDLQTSSNQSTSNYEETSYEVDTGLAYQYNSNFGFDFGVTLSGVDSNIDNNNYTRDEVYVGVRGTY